MIALCKRNLKIYFSNKNTVFFSLLGAIIVFVLYVLFLRKNMIAQFSQINDGATIADFWVLGGILATTSLTTSFSAVGQLVKDKTDNKLMDFVITDIRNSHLLLGYFFSSLIIAILMQFSVLIFCLGYFYFQESISFTAIMGVKTIGIICLSALNATSASLFICSFIRTESTLRTFSSMLGAISGFICTAYLPIGSFNELTETIIKLLPISYASSSFRRVLVSPLLVNLSGSQNSQIKEYLGIGYMWNGHLSSATCDISVLVLTTCCFLLLMTFLSKKVVQVSMR